MAESLLNPVLWAGVAALAHALLGAFILLGGAGGLVRNYLLMLAAAGILWGVISAQPANIDDHGVWGFAATIVVLLAWYLLTARLLRGPYGHSMPELIRRLLRTFWLVAIVTAATAQWLAYAAPLAWASRVAYLLVLFMALVCYALAAQLARDAPIESRTASRAMVAATGIASASLVLPLAVAALGAGIPRQLLGFAAVGQSLAALFLFFSLRLRPQWSLATFVSPDARSYAPRLLASGFIALLVTALLPAMMAMETVNAQLATAAIVVAVLLPLSLLMFSERLNARLRVFINKHFLPFRYDYREEWLRLIDTLVGGESDSPLFERSIRALAQIIGSPAGVLWLRQTEHGPMFAARAWNTRLMPDAVVPLDDPALRFMLDRQWIIDTAELNRRPELYDGLNRPAWLAAFPDGLLLVPLISGDHLIGFVVLLQASSAFRLTFEEIDLLRTSGRQVAAFLAQYQADQKLTEVRQFEAFNRLTAFVMHDLKNLIAQQSLVVRNAARHKDNPAFFEDAIATVDNSVARMQKLLQQLQSGDATGPRQRVRLAVAVGESVSRCSGRQPAPEFIDETGDLEVWIDRDRLTAVIAHLIRNAQEATTAEGRVTVSVGAQDTAAIVTIEDDGCGMEPEFVRTRLFRPFDTTKGSKGMGIGAYQARTFVMEAGGSLRVESDPGAGTRVIIQLPLDDVETMTASAG